MTEEKNVAAVLEQKNVSPTSDLKKLMSSYDDYIEAEEIIESIKDKSEEILTSYYEIAGYLRRFAEKQYFKVLGYKDLFTCCKTLLPNFSDTLIKNLLLVGNKCFEENSEDYSEYDIKDTYKNIPWSKLVELVSVPEDKELVELISDKSVKAIREVKKDIKTYGADKVVLREKYIKSALDKIRSSLNTLSDYELKAKSGKWDSSIVYYATYSDGSFKVKIRVEFNEEWSHGSIGLSNSYGHSFYDDKQLDQSLKSIKEDISSLKKENESRLETKKNKSKVDKSKAPKRLTDDYDAYVKDIKNWKLLVNYSASKISIFELTYLNYRFIQVLLEDDSFYFRWNKHNKYYTYFYDVVSGLKAADDEVYQTWFDKELKKVEKAAKAK